MVGEDNDTCGEGQHDWIYENEDDGVHCYQCDAEAIDCTIEQDGYVSDGEWIAHLHITVHTHTHQLDDALKAVREAPPKDRSIKWDNLEPIDYNLNTGSAPKVTAEPRLKFEIECDETDTTYQEFEE